jgi:hypothetical protein
VRTTETERKDWALKEAPDSPALNWVTHPRAFRTAKTLPTPSCLQGDAIFIDIPEQKIRSANFGTKNQVRKHAAQPHMPARDAISFLYSGTNNQDHKHAAQPIMLARDMIILWYSGTRNQASKNAAHPLPVKYVLLSWCSGPRYLRRDL